MPNEANVWDLPGTASSPDTVRASQARTVLQYLEAGLEPYVRLVEYRATETADVLVLEVEPERPQRPVHDIRTIERLAIHFYLEGGSPAEVVSLRKDFPLVPHLNLRPEGSPKSLCLFEERHEDIRLRWTPAVFIRQIRTWLAKTARGELHAEDQQLEPLLLGFSFPLVVPHDLFNDQDETALEKLAVHVVQDSRGITTLIAERWSDESRRQSGLNFITTVLTGSAQQHGVIYSTPKSLKELDGFLRRADVNLIATLRERLVAWRDDEDLLDARLIILTYLPKTRSSQGSVEAVDLWAFLTLETVREVGEALGLWQTQDGQLARLIPPDTARLGGAVKLSILNPTFALSRMRAAQLNAADANDSRRIVAVGLGSLGSQVTKALTRAAFGEWTLVDRDHFLPHNGARHDLSGQMTGFSKADAVAFQANATIDGPNIAESIVADVLSPGDKRASLEEVFARADVILDMSASVAVARTLTHDVDSSARRVSLFLSPSGRDLVLLAEDKARITRLDQLEMQYYRLLLERAELADHLAIPGGRVRYGQSCRDLSNRIPQDSVMLHAAIGSRALKQILALGEASIRIWQATDELSVAPLSSVPRGVYARSVGGWTLCWDERLVEKVYQWRAERLPNETGGVLVGTYDMQRKIIYVVDTLPSPPDSKEYPTLYIRGAEGLKAAVKEVARRTAGMLEYVGEWHSHPEGHGPALSDDDRDVLTWLTNLMAVDALPPLMLVAGDRYAFEWYLEG